MFCLHLLALYGAVLPVVFSVITFLLSFKREVVLKHSWPAKLGAFLGAGYMIVLFAIWASNNMKY